MPEKGEYTILPMTKAGEKKGLHLAALVGAGSYIMRDETLVSSGGVLTSVEATALATRLEAEANWLINAPVPLLILVYNFNVFAIESGFVRMTWAREGYGLEASDSNEGVDYLPFDSSSSPLTRTCYKVHNTEKSVPPPGAPVSIEYIPRKTETLEFLVAPPKLPTDAIAE
jgi:hypothetical protein